MGGWKDKKELQLSLIAPLTPMGSSDLTGHSSTGDGGRGGTAGATG